MDVISLHQWGFIEAVASLGTAFTEQQAELLKRFNAIIYLCFDSDGAGKKACKRAIPILREKKLEGRVISLSPYKDPDEFLKAEGREAFQKRIDGAQNAFLWEVEERKAEFNLQDPAGMQKYMESIAALLKVAREQMLRVESLQYLLDKEEEKGHLQFGLRKSSGGVENKREEKWNSSLEEEFLSVLMQRSESVEKAKAFISVSDFKAPLLQEVYEKLLQGIPMQEILDSYQEEEEKYRKLVKLYHGDYYHMDLERDEERKLLADYIRRMKLQRIEEEIEQTVDAEALSGFFKKRDYWEKFSLSV